MFKNSGKKFVSFFLYYIPGVAYQPHSSMTVSAAFVADVDRWLRRVGRLLLPLLPLYSFMHRSILLSSFHSCVYDCSPVPTIICGCLPCRSVDSRHFHVAFACISVAEIRTAYCQGWGRLQKPDYDYDYSAHKIIDYDYSGD